MLTSSGYKEIHSDKKNLVTCIRSNTYKKKRPGTDGENSETPQKHKQEQLSNPHCIISKKRFFIPIFIKNQG